MTIVSTSRADRFAARPPREIGFFLVYGANEGLVNERAKAILKAKDSGAPQAARVIRMDGDDIARDPGLLWDEAYALSMFGDRRSVWIDAQARDFRVALAALFAKPPEDCAVVVKAGVLKKGSALRSVFENAVNAASVECHADSDDALEAFMQREIQALGMTISGPAREALRAQIGADRQTIRNEIAKLLLYAEGRSEIVVEDVNASLGNEGLSTVDKLVDQSLQGTRSSVAADALQFFEANTETELLLLRLVSRLTLLYRIELEIEHGGSFEAVQRNSGIRLPLQAVETLAVQATRWNSRGAVRQLNSLREASARSRTDIAIMRVALARVLWALSSQRSPARH